MNNRTRRKRLKGKSYNWPEPMEKKNLPETSDMSGVRAGSGTSDKRYNDVSYIKAVEATKERIAPAFNKGPLQLVGNPKDLRESNGK